MKIYEKASLFFTGLVYICVGTLILLYPKLLYYWVAVVFFIHGLSSLVRSLQKIENRRGSSVK